MVRFNQGDFGGDFLTSLMVKPNNNDICSICDCQEGTRTIDCRQRGLTYLPWRSQSVFQPNVIDLCENDQLIVVTRDELNGFPSHSELRLPRNIEYISKDALKSLPNLRRVLWEDELHLGGMNIVTNRLQEFSDICCQLGQTIDLPTPSKSLTFCNLETFSPGVDSIHESSIEYRGPSLETVTESSLFLREAVESVEKCAEYCHRSPSCNYFSYDQRYGNVEHWCIMLLDRTRHPSADFADLNKTVPGHISGIPPKTRHSLGNAKVIFSATSLAVNNIIGYQTTFEVSLGANPLRGAVWVNTFPVTETELDIKVIPPRVVLYDNQTTVPVTISIEGAHLLDATETLVFTHVIQSCDVAFLLKDNFGTNSLVLEVVPPSKGDDNERALIIPIMMGCVALIFIATAIFVHQTKRRLKLEATTWRIRHQDLEFGNPPTVLGRGSFGMVVLASYRGTKVAVKRVLPPQSASKKLDVDMFEIPKDIASVCSNSTEKKGKRSKLLSSTRRGSSSMLASRDGSVQLGSSTGMPDNTFSRMKSKFIEEMSHLAKLRHPNITTVMGAVVETNSDPMLVMELMDHGSLHDLLHNDTVILRGGQIHEIFRCVAKGMRFLHSGDVLHGDLKAANILVDSHFQAKVADFGLTQKRQLGAVSTPYFMPPKLFVRGALDTKESDIYSFGVVLFEVYARQDPYKGEEPAEVLRQVKDPVIQKRPVLPANSPAEMISLSKACYSHDPAQRPTFQEVDELMDELSSMDLEPGRMQFSHQIGKDELSTNPNQSLDCFPPQFAETLERGGKIESQSHEMVTVLFADVCHFKRLCMNHSQITISDMLSRLYHQFDKEVKKFDCFKIETVRDNYMCCSNLAKPQPSDHVKRIADLASCMIEVANRTLIDEEDPSSGTVMIRVGFHSGPVLATVVDRWNLRFSVVGETVNTAARLESHSMRSRIQCSEDSAFLLQEQDPENAGLVRGSAITIKGREDAMITYWVHEGCRGSRVHVPQEQSLRSARNALRSEIEDLEV